MIFYTVINTERLLGNGIELSAQLELSNKPDSDFLVKWLVDDITVLNEYFSKSASKPNTLFTNEVAENYYRNSSIVSLNLQKGE